MNVVCLGTKVIESERKRVRGREKRPEKQHGVGEEHDLWIRIRALVYQMRSSLERVHYRADIWWVFNTC